LNLIERHSHKQKIRQNSINYQDNTKIKVKVALKVCKIMPWKYLFRV